MPMRPMPPAIYISRKRKFASSSDAHCIVRPALPAPPPSSPTARRCMTPDVANTKQCAVACELVSTVSVAERDADSIHADKPSEIKAQAPPVKRMKYTQMIIDLGGNPQRRCKECGMEYVPSNADDLRLHKDFHSATVGGVDVPASLTDKWMVVAQCTQRSSRGRLTSTPKQRRANPAAVRDAIVRVASTDRLALRRWAKAVLEVAEKELGAVETAQETLWQVRGNNGDKIDRFKAYLYIRGKKCVGICLAECITDAVRLQDNADGLLGMADGVKIPARVGISRIWISKEYRRLGIATDLLKAAQDNAEGDQHQMCRANMAFSQPTESGRHLARAWHGNGTELQLYDETDDA